MLPLGNFGWGFSKEETSFFSSTNLGNCGLAGGYPGETIGGIRIPFL